MPIESKLVKDEMLDCNETNLTAHLKEYEDFVKLYNVCISPELVLLSAR